ncbi:helix-turn-helix transcriptional regulator [Corynebacterium sphenisci]|uniref:helix-turn-helix transcriptional regulator n=1 Tax=Corynebacterium sphenisci TaxID=191493 RepID=UPI0026E02979|nr:helix-turn-helix domain-containing protein [Corynebacterium sphenisci]MDO5731445.1 helix-turn-helix domain-containing protein [Corynebacterium sphenisci]
MERSEADPVRPEPAEAPTEGQVRVLRAVADRRGAPVTLAELAERLGGHPNTTRRHLTALVEAGRLDVAPLPQPGSGRPPLGYRLTRAGRRALAGAEPDRHRELLQATATVLARRGATAAQAREIGREWGARLDLGRKVDAGEGAGDAWSALLEVLDVQGFDPAPVAPGGAGAADPAAPGPGRGGADADGGGAADDGDPAAAVLRGCPYLDVAAEHPEFMCPVHEGMAGEVLSRLGGPDRVELTPHSVAGDCLLRPLPEEEPGA